MSTREQLAGLCSGAIDIGFVRLPVGGDFEQLPVIPDSLAIVRSLESNLARKGARMLAIMAPGRSEALPCWLLTETVRS